MRASHNQSRAYDMDLTSVCKQLLDTNLSIQLPPTCRDATVAGVSTARPPANLSTALSSNAWQSGSLRESAQPPRAGTDGVRASPWPQCSEQIHLPLPPSDQSLLLLHAQHLARELASCSTNPRDLHGAVQRCHGRHGSGAWEALVLTLEHLLARMQGGTEPPQQQEERMDIRWVAAGRGTYTTCTVRYRPRRRAKACKHASKTCQ